VEGRINDGDKGLSVGTGRERGTIENLWCEDQGHPCVDRGRQLYRRQQQNRGAQQKEVSTCDGATNLKGPNETWGERGEICDLGLEN
jgi:hypothetical protein